MGVIKKLAGSVREYKKPALITVILMILEVIIEVTIPFMTANLINSIQSTGGVDMKELLATGGLLIVMACLSLTCGGLGGYTCAKASSGFSKNLRSDVFERIQNFGFENIDKFSSASLVTRLTTDASNVQMSFMMLIRTAIRSPLMFIFSIIMSYLLGGVLAATFVVVIPILVFGLLMISRKAMPAFRRVFKKYDKLNESIEENVRGMRVVKGFSREDYEKEKFGKASENIRFDFTKAERIIALNTPLMQFCMYFNMIFILWVGSKIALTTSGTVVNIGHISAMLNYGMQILMSLMMLSMIYVMLTMSAESARRICEVLDEKSTLTNPETPLTIVQDGSITFENVSFKYSKEAKRFALENINVNIKSGMTVGIIGGTGSSKSTLVQLIPRLYDTTEGSVKVGGVDVREYDVKSLRDSVAMVLQKNLLFAGTINENLRWGNEEATQEEIIEACRLAQADDFVKSFPDGYETHIEQGGTNVSGGQKQRLCIARALLKKPKVLILDDSTSAVDTKTDAFIREGFKSYIPQTTKIIIAQRITSVQDADLIIVMDNGKIESMGTHDELLKMSEIYKEVYEQQIGGVKYED
ncbi:MAG: ABC transporter ATP-binding protein [Clostridia bacterium]|nr:ABC transporter ATP-binding protein [Clostridia bacterium]